MAKIDENRGIENGQPGPFGEKVGKSGKTGGTAEARSGPVSHTGDPSPPPRGLPAALEGFDLSTPEKARKSLALVITARACGAIDRDLAQSLTWQLSVYLPAHRAEKWSELERRIEAIESRVEVSQ